MVLGLDKLGSSVAVGASTPDDDVRLLPSLNWQHFLDCTTLCKFGLDVLNVSTSIFLQRSLVALVSSILPMNILDPLHNEDSPGVEVADDAAVEVRVEHVLVQHQVLAGLHGRILILLEFG